MIISAKLDHFRVVTVPDNQVQKRLSSLKLRERHSGKRSLRSISHDYMDLQRRKPNLCLQLLQPQHLYHKQMSQRTHGKGEIGRDLVVYPQAVLLRKLMSLDVF